MSLIYKRYDEEKKVDHAWYESSNILYSECVDNVDDFKTLFVVFKHKDGTNETYRYDNVHVADYLRFRNSESQGKALNMFIKSRKNFDGSVRYPHQKQEQSIYNEELDKELNEFLLEEEKKRLENTGILTENKEETNTIQDENNKDKD